MSFFINFGFKVFYDELNVLNFPRESQYNK